MGATKIVLIAFPQVRGVHETSLLSGNRPGERGSSTFLSYGVPLDQGDSIRAASISERGASAC